MLRGSVISYDWYKTAEGQGLLAHLTEPATGHRKLYGLLEQVSRQWRYIIKIRRVILHRF